MDIAIIIIGLVTALLNLFTAIILYKSSREKH